MEGIMSSVDNFFNFVSFTIHTKNLTIFSLVILWNWSSEFSCLKKIRIMFHCAVSSRKNIEIFKICPNILGKSGWRKIKIRAPTTMLSLKIIDQILCQRYQPPLRRTPSLKYKGPPPKRKSSPYQRHADKVGLGAVFDLQNQFYVIW